MASPVMQFQILSKAPDETARFYSGVFGWTVHSGNPMGHRQIDTGSSSGIQGGIWPAPPEAPNFVQLFIAVENVTASAQRAESMGAKILVPPTPLPDGDEIAVLLDPQGMSFGLSRRR